MLDNIKSFFGASKYKEIRSTKYYFLVAVSIILLSFFTLTKNVFPDRSNVMNTDFYDKKDLSTQKVYLTKWEYSKENKMMEIELETEKNSSVARNDLSFVAKAKSNTGINLDVKTVLKEDNLYIIQIYNLPKNFQVIALTCKEEGAINLVDNNENLETTFYGDYRKIEINEEIRTKTKSEYLKESINRQIADKKKEIKAVEKNIEVNKSNIKGLEKEIDTLNFNKKYQTDSEKTSTETEIQSIKEVIKNIETEITKLKNDIENYKEQIQKLKLKLQDINEERK